MDYTAFAHTQSLLNAQKDSPALPLNAPKPQQIEGVLEIADRFDVFLFSMDETLVCGGQTIPSAAIAIPALRRMNKRIGVFTLDDTERKKDILAKANRFGFSISRNSILKRNDFDNWEDAFPLALPYRTLMICSDPVGELSLARFLGMRSLLISGKPQLNQGHLNLWANYQSPRV